MWSEGKSNRWRSASSKLKRLSISWWSLERTCSVRASSGARRLNSSTLYNGTSWYIELIKQTSFRLFILPQPRRGKLTQTVYIFRSLSRDGVFRIVSFEGLNVTDPFLAWLLRFFLWPVWLLCLMHGGEILGDPAGPLHVCEGLRSHAGNEKEIRVHGAYRGPHRRRVWWESPGRSWERTWSARN